ncbi:MAG: hypothetical protein AB1584_02995 [Pseudomonadota bacterium]
MKKEAGDVLRGLPFCSSEQTQQKVYVLVYVNQTGNFRVVLKFFSALLPALLHLNGGEPENFRVFGKYF